MKEKKEATEKELLAKKKKEAQEFERMSILSKTDEVKEETFDFDIEGAITVKNEIADMALEAIDDPEEKYLLYYKVMMRLLKKQLPKGQKNKQMRDYIYEEKNTLLTGHRKGPDGRRNADSRMAYRPEMKILIDIIYKWVTTNGAPYELYVTLRDLNISKGYGSPE